LAACRTGAAGRANAAGRHPDGIRRERSGIRVRLDAFIQGLAQAGWIEGRNIRLDVRWTNVDVARTQVLGKELIALQPDVLVAATTLPAAALQQQTRTIPIVFASVADPVGAGFVASLARPGANITGLISEEASLVGTELELLKEIAPRLAKVAIMFNPDTAPGGGGYYLGSFDAALCLTRGGRYRGRHRSQEARLDRERARPSAGSDLRVRLAFLER
jgi:hypothetical protein